MAFINPFSQYLASKTKKPATVPGGGYGTSQTPIERMINRPKSMTSPWGATSFGTSQPPAQRPTLGNPTMGPTPGLNVSTSPQETIQTAPTQSPTMSTLQSPTVTQQPQGTIQDVGNTPALSVTQSGQQMISPVTQNALPMYSPGPLNVADGPSPNVSTNYGMTTDPNKPAPLVDPGAISEAGKLYESRVLAGLQGKDQASLDMTERANTQASRNLYMAGKQGQEDALAGGLDAGSLQYQRTQDRALAGAREANLAGAQGLGDYLITRAEDIMTRGRGVESDSYNRATGERDEAGALRLENRGNVDNYINSFGDAQFKNYLRSVQAAGGDVYAAAAGGMDRGTIRPEYASNDPVETLRDSARSWVDVTQPGLKESDPAAYEAAVIERVRQTDKSITSPISDAATLAAEKKAVSKWSAGNTLTDEDISAIVNGSSVPHAAALPVSGSQLQGIIDSSPNGLLVVGSTLYKMSQRTPDGSEKIYNYVTDTDGNYLVLFNGRWIPADPKTGNGIQPTTQGA